MEIKLFSAPVCPTLQTLLDTSFGEGLPLTTFWHTRRREQICGQKEIVFFYFLTCGTSTQKYRFLRFQHPDGFPPDVLVQPEARSFPFYWTVLNYGANRAEDIEFASTALTQKFWYGLKVS